MNARSAIEAIDDQATHFSSVLLYKRRYGYLQIEEDRERDWGDSKAREEGTRLYVNPQDPFKTYGSSGPSTIRQYVSI
jgi:hypothetical protein